MKTYEDVEYVVEHKMLGQDGWWRGIGDTAKTIMKARKLAKGLRQRFVFVRIAKRVITETIVN